MKNRTVYLSKSNLTSPDDLIFTRAFLQDIYNMLFEFDGGAYNADKLKKANDFVLLPYPESHDGFVSKFNGIAGQGFFLGKGQYSELEIARDEKKNCFIVTSVTKDKIEFAEIVSMNVFDTTNYKTRYASVIATQENHTFERVNDENNIPESDINVESKFNSKIILNKLKNGQK